MGRRGPAHRSHTRGLAGPGPVSSADPQSPEHNGPGDADGRTRPTAPASERASGVRAGGRGGGAGGAADPRELAGRAVLRRRLAVPGPGAPSIARGPAHLPGPARELLPATRPAALVLAAGARQRRIGGLLPRREPAVPGRVRGAARAAGAPGGRGTGRYARRVLPGAPLRRGCASAVGIGLAGAAVAGARARGAGALRARVALPRGGGLLLRAARQGGRHPR